ncbi:unnamed protein product [Gadus morhua 'NCC']
MHTFHSGRTSVTKHVICQGPVRAPCGAECCGGRDADAPQPNQGAALSPCNYSRSDPINNDQQQQQQQQQPPPPRQPPALSPASTTETASCPVSCLHHRDSLLPCLLPLHPTETASCPVSCLHHRDSLLPCLLPPPPRQPPATSYQPPATSQRPPALDSWPITAPGV